MGTDVPVTVTDGAAAHIAALGMQREFEQMIEYTRLTVPDLERIEVILDGGPCGNDPGILIWAHRPDPGPGDDPTDRNWGGWQIGAFPPEVWKNFTMLSAYETPADGR